MAKPIQYCKVISLQVNKFILKKKKILQGQVFFFFFNSEDILNVFLTINSSIHIQS